MIHKPISESLAFPKRLQGTDGVRGMTCPARHPSVSGLTPVEAFLKRGFLTDEFVELYCFCYVKLLEQRGDWHPGQEIVIGWDPRDTEGIYHQAATRGVRKAGANAIVTGILPTPAIPLYLLYRDAAGGIMITASHNPPDQNGIKLFTKTLGLKPLPRDDEELSALVYQTPYSSLYDFPLKGSYEEAQSAALALWYQFFQMPSNTWIEDKSPLQRLLLVVDPAYGCLRGIASQVFKQLGVNRVIEVSNDSSGQVNVNSGVTILEGIKEIDGQLRDDLGNTLQNSRAIQTIFEMGRRYRDSILKGNLWVAGAVFDADGDRFYRLDYDPLKDRIIVLSGDEIAYHQAKYLITRFPKELLGAPYVNTVESDLNSSLAAAELGYRPIIEAVGDKWLLVQAALNWLETQLEQNGQRHLEELRQKGVSTVAGIEDLFRSSRFKVQSSKTKDQTPAPCRYEPESYATDQRFRIIKGCSIGSEASGHTVTPGLLNTKAGTIIPVFIGNGLKSAINTFVATESLYCRSDIARYLDQIHRPFPKGFQKALQVYYTDKNKFYDGSPLWHQLESTIKETGSGLWVKRAYSQEPNMLYLSRNDSPGRQKGAVFIRNSGTEDKTVVSLRGPEEDQDKLLAAGETVLKILYQNMKDQGQSYARAESQILKTLNDRGPCSPDDLISLLPGINWGRLVNELSKQRLIEYRDSQVCLTPLGSWYIQEVP